MKRVRPIPKWISHFETIFGHSIKRFMLILNLQESSLSLNVQESSRIQMGGKEDLPQQIEIPLGGGLKTQNKLGFFLPI